MRPCFFPLVPPEMKRCFFVLTAMALGSAPAISSAQSPYQTNPDFHYATPAGPKGHPSINLTADEREALMTASEAARNDPRVKVAAMELATAKKQEVNAMLAADPGIAPLLDKATGDGGHGMPGARLTADQREELRAARESIKDSTAAGAFQKASDDYHAAIRQAMLTVDPTIGPVLDKLPGGGIEVPGRGFGFDRGPGERQRTMPHGDRNHHDVHGLARPKFTPDDKNANTGSDDDAWHWQQPGH